MLEGSDFRRDGPEQGTRLLRGIGGEEYGGRKSDEGEGCQGDHREEVARQHASPEGDDEDRHGIAEDPLSWEATASIEVAA